MYHRAVMLPRLRHENEIREHQRQLDAERVALERAGDNLNTYAGSSSVGHLNLEERIGGGQGLTGQDGGDGAGDDNKTHATAPEPEMDATCGGISPPQNRALNAVLNALSNYNDDELEFEDDIMDNHRPDGWGVESNMEGTTSRERPVVLHGAGGILSRHAHLHPQTEGMNNEEFNSPYHVMEDMDMVDRMCVQEGSVGYPAYNWVGAFYDGKQELMVHFQEYWRDIVDDVESGSVEKFLLICEYPISVLRKVCQSTYHTHELNQSFAAASCTLSP